ncbi:MAG: MFS transporter [Proteobacteria bacterium]|nr:MFS transporter [Pseudomonadota bacterium]
MPTENRQTPPYSQAYLRYALGILCVVYIVNFVDRQVLAILLQSIKDDLLLTDLQLGVLSGTAFGLFYATLGIPIARLADRFSRKSVLTISLALWSGMTALCGAATGFATLLLYRIGVGVGEAGGGPPAHSMISDYFPPEKRATALGIFSLGVPFGILVGFLAGGWLDQTLGWRTAFIVVGLPGLVVALIVALTLREPPRGLSEGLDIQRNSNASPTAGSAIAFLWRMRSFRHVALGSALYAFVGYAATSWAPSFLARSHGMTAGEIGTALALIIGLGGGLGIYLGGVLADRLAIRNPLGRVWVPAGAQLLSFPFSFIIYTTSNTTLALVMFTIPAFLGLMYQGPAFAVTQSLATPKMRATAAAILLFAINIVGLGIGPVFTGAVSDALEPTLGGDSLRYALLITSMVLAWSAFHFYRAGRTLVADLETARQAAERESAGLPTTATG